MSAGVSRRRCRPPRDPTSANRSWAPVAESMMGSHWPVPMYVPW